MSKHTFNDSMAFRKTSAAPCLPQVLALVLFVLMVRVFDVSGERLAQIADGCVQGLDLGLQAIALLELSALDAKNCALP
eukprot:4565930-Pyramimonas_sp.AAC.2